MSRNFKARLAKLESRNRGGIVVVRRFEGETTDEALAAERPGFTPNPQDLVVIVRKPSGRRDGKGIE